MTCTYLHTNACIAFCNNRIETTGYTGFGIERPYSSNMHNKIALEQKLDYIHHNPLSEKWKLAEQPANYNYSSAKFYLLNEENFNFLTHYTNHI